MGKVGGFNCGQIFRNVLVLLKYLKVPGYNIRSNKLILIRFILDLVRMSIYPTNVNGDLNCKN